MGAKIASLLVTLVLGIAVGVVIGAILVVVMNGYGESDATASSPKEKPVHPNDLLATVYYALGVDPDMEIRNHLNQPRELVKGKIVTDLFG